jgi:DNA-directed RNA polymerase beta' subunit
MERTIAKANNTVIANLLSKKPTYQNITKEIQSKPKVESCKKVSKQELQETLLQINQTRENLPEFELISTILGVFDNDTITKLCVCEIKNTDSAGAGSLNDPKMGCIDNESKCPTCGQDAINCVGHHGYIQLRTPIYHPFYGKLIAKVLSAICLTCSKPFLSKEEMEKKGILNQQFEVRLNMIVKESENINHCTYKGSDNTNSCGAHIPVEWDKDKFKLVFSLNKNTSSVKYEGRKDETEEDYEANKSTLGKVRVIPINVVQMILNAISDENAELLGFSNGSHPKHLIMNYWPVIPPVARQPKVVDGKVMDDQLTNQYKMILKANMRITPNMQAAEKQQAAKDLYNEIEQLISGQDKTGKGDYKSIETRIQGKEGLIRNNMMGRRVNYSGRTVIGPGPYLKIGQVGVPRAFAKTLLKRCNVVPFNKISLQNLFDNGKVLTLIPASGKYKGQLISNLDKWRKKGYKLQNGDKVERELQDGDYVIINRQPTLHRQSFMGCQVVLHNDMNLRLPLEIVKAFNADFDGDEMNIHVVHDEQSIAELMLVASMDSCIMNSQTNKPNYAPYYDALIGVYLLTKDDVNFVDEKERKEKELLLQELEEKISKYVTERKEILKRLEKLLEQLEFEYQGEIKETVQNTLLNNESLNVLITLLDNNGIDSDEIKEMTEKLNYVDKIILPYDQQIDKINTYLSSTLDAQDFFDIITYIKKDKGVDIIDLKERAKKKNIPFYTGRMLFSAALPRDFYYRRDDPEKKNDILIEDGILITGRITSQTVGLAHNSIIQVMYKNYYPDGGRIANEFSSNIKFITDQYLARRGFTVGYDDCVIPESKRREQETILLEEYMKAQSAAYKISKKLDDPLEDQKREAQITAYLDTIKLVGKKIVNLVEKNKTPNSIVDMYLAGSKGTPLNVAQITTTIGQTFLKGKRFPCNMTNNTRCLPTFEPESVDIRSRGFVLNSFMTGLSVSEFFLFQAAGRTGLIDTALKTADVGDMHRKTTKILEDIIVMNDGSVRNNRGQIVQFMYGEDGFDAANLQFTPGASGNIPSFIDIDADVNEINSRYGF